ncbi:MAG: transglutaminase domain-containing protein [Chloroflexi bacterium]|nr:transglutaminase domain-containing protein [Chloroflexota bacterium]
MRQSTSARWWDLPAALLLLAALTTAVRRLIITEWADDLGMAGTLTFLGVLAGLALGQSRFSSRLASVIALIYGLFAVFWQLGLTLEDDILWAERVISLIGRMGIGLDQLARREAVRDPLLFLLLVASLSWMLSVHAGYALTRRGRTWRAIIPTGVAMLVIQTADPFLPSRVWLLAAYLFFSLLLLARLAYLQRRVRWEGFRASLPPYLGLDLIRVILLPTALLILLAWTMPALASILPAERAWDLTTQHWDSLLDFLNNAFASLGGEGEGRGGSYYGKRLSLGHGKVLGDTPILAVQVPPGFRASTRYYWRARVYDHYADGQWSSTLSATQPINPADSDLTFPEAEGRLTATFVFTSAAGTATFYVAPQPLWVSRPARADLAYNPDGTTDLSALHASPRLRAGQAYQVRSSISVATADQLRAAGTDYPRWVANRYLQLPPTITPRTRELARQVAAGLDNPYDIAIAVTDYLRAQISYADTTPSLDSDQEPLDWFLFDLRQGFCNYYASAEIVLLRSLGIPARLAVGFAQGTRQSQGNVYQVRQLDAHAWPEVYFPSLGWVEFEPTVSQPPLSRPSGEGQHYDAAGSIAPGETGAGQRDNWEDRLEELLASDEDILSEPSTAAASRSRTAVASWALFLALALMAVTLAWHVRRRRGMPPLPALLEQGLHRFDLRPPAALRLWALWTRLPPLGRAYLEFNQALAWLGAPPDRADTPAERAAALTRLLPEAAVPAQQLLAEYHATTYGPRSGSAQIARTASRAIRRLSWRSGVKMRVDRMLRPLLVFARRPTSSHPSSR